MILHTERFGSGEPILFLHTSLQTGATDFEQQRQYFTESHRVIAADLRGHGRSISADFSDYLEDSAEDIAETLVNLNLDEVHIVGASLGALVGLIFAKKYPEQVKSLTISGIVPEKPANWEEIMSDDAEKLEKLLIDEQIVNYFDDIHESNWQEIIGMSQKDDWYPFDETGDLSMLTMPVLYIDGEAAIYEKNKVPIYPKINDNIHISIIPFASHNVHVEQADIYTQIVADFIGRYSS